MAVIRSQTALRILLYLFGMGLQLAIAVAFMIVQSVALFWFLSRSRTYEIYPGAEGVTFEDYRG